MKIQKHREGQNQHPGVLSCEKQGRLQSWGTRTPHQTFCREAAFDLAMTSAHHRAGFPARVSRMPRGQPKERNLRKSKIKTRSYLWLPLLLTADWSGAKSQGLQFSHKGKDTRTIQNKKIDRTCPFETEVSLLLLYLKQFWYIPLLQLYKRERKIFFSSLMSDSELFARTVPISLLLISVPMSPSSHISLFPDRVKAKVLFCFCTALEGFHLQRHRREIYDSLEF